MKTKTINASSKPKKVSSLQEKHKQPLKKSEKYKRKFLKDK